ncbi:MAG: hypothetical protein LQ339_000950 [Xanthoria mediterranea]|nr:MAG: hypothetical protein LQ339_000950 [Xanthoria mediterranea]
MESDNPPATDPSVAADARLLLQAASRHDLTSLKELLGTVPASVQDPETGFTPLHAAIAGADPSQRASLDDKVPNGGSVHGDTGEKEVEEEAGGEEAAIETVKQLLLNGAIWNDLDKNDETPGCLALRLGLPDLYNIMVDAGVRAEILLTRLDEYERLDDQSSDDEEEVIPEETTPKIPNNDDNKSPTNQQPPLSSTDPLPNQPSYLSSPLSFQPDRILDASTNSIMMSWETTLMSRSAALLAPAPGLRILNIGHGMGIIDSEFQSTNPRTHHIVEAHPAVLARMRENGWYAKPNVVVHEGRWQDILPSIIEKDVGEQNGPLLFDVIYFDTFAEPYSALRRFFDDFVIGLLDDDGGRWGFFNGLGADRQVCYDVYGKVLELDLFEAGFEVEWTGVEVPDLEARGEWDGVKRPYWRLKEYRLPVCRFVG